ncbi:SET domain-containing protein [Eremomyces bilateralis CBS 781.70]|uniref:SET domain-containing protein n=1 Tax=Eremomyces bilateralis CBS 781.70 TaxID=1392243 RepID=A0A6G1G6F2_9PEZI|nr:SET domain-containing protein [Eremomyces bilateralis CBS 781.70]KAF1813675.1 SET domain-containing protein [Eremomyces bilateralis CBS 781.70]
MDAKLQRFLQWFTSNGGYLNPHVQVQTSEEQGIHVIAKDTVSALHDSSEPFPIVTCPLSLTLSYLNAASHPDVHQTPSPAASQLLSTSDRTTVGAFLLMEQKLAGEGSFWAAYIDCLPPVERLTSPMLDGEREGMWLRGTNLDLFVESSAVGVRRRLWREDWEGAVRVLGEKGVDTAPFTWDLYNWAMSIFSSRSITSRGVIRNEPDPLPLLFPMVDLLNHHPTARVDWHFDATGAMTIAAESPPKPGDQVYNHFGPFPNEKLLLGYGFALEDNPYDEVTVQLGGIRPGVHELLRASLPERFPGPTLTPESVRFSLIGSSHAVKGYKDSPLPCLRGVPPDLFAIMEAEVRYGRMQAGEGEEGVRMDALVGLFGMVERKLEGIRRWDGGVEGEREERGRYARIYREGQVRILEEVMGEIEAYLDAAWEGGS